MSPVVRTVINEAEVRDIAGQEWLRDYMLRLARATVVATARRLAPVRQHGRSHGGAASIRAVAGRDAQGWYVDVSWDPRHAYMRFPNRAHRFLQRAVEQNEQP